MKTRSNQPKDNMAPSTVKTNLSNTLGKLSDSEKLDFIIKKMEKLDVLTDDVSEIFRIFRT